MTKIQEIKNAPEFDGFLKQAQAQPVIIDSDIKEKLFLIYEKMKDVAVCGGDEYRNIWFHIERGEIEDYGDYEDFLEENLVNNYDDFKEMWLYDYPEKLKWYDFAVCEYNDEYYFYIDSKLTFHIAKELPQYYGEIKIIPLVSYLEKEINRYVDWLQADEAGYNSYVNENLSYNRRTGKILREDFWKIFPEGKKQLTRGIRKKDFDILKDIANQSKQEEENWNEEGRNYIPEMTAGKFFDYCRMGYEANNYFKGKEMPSVEMYKAFADGRHEGLTEIEPNSVKAFSNWYHTRSRLGHPWEICRGGNSTHISLYVEKRKAGWYLRLAGSSAARANETVKFALAFYNNQVPFYLSEAEEIYRMICGTDYIGIVPQEVFPRYCHSLFSGEDERIIDFMNLYWEETGKIIAAAKWYPIEIKKKF